MSYKNVLVAVKTVFQNISVADLSLVLSYHVNFLIQSAHRRLDKSILCDWHLHYHDYFAAAYYSSRLLNYPCSFFERLFNVHSNIKQFHLISSWHDRSSQSHIDKTSDHHSDKTEKRNCTMWKYYREKKIHLNGSHQVKNAQSHLITVHYVALLGIKGFKDP